VFIGLPSQRSDLLDTLERLALTDALTGLDNRRAWEAGLRREHARARREGTPLSVAMLDLDGFKGYNDAHGHQAGDELLREIAQRWCAQLRPSDILARYGVVCREGEGYRLIDGERRYRACDEAAVVEVPVIVRQADEQTAALDVALVSNMERVELTPATRRRLSRVCSSGA